MTTFVAGATGLAGSAIVRELNAQGNPVIGISSKELNLLDRQATIDYLDFLKPKIVINAAAKVGGISANKNFPVEFLSKNLQIQTNLMDASHYAGVDKFVFLSSSCAYPLDCPRPIKEEYLLSGTLEPTNSAYAVAKIAGIELVKSYRKEFGYNWISVMPTNLYGPNDNFDLENSHVFAALIRKFSEAKVFGKDTINLWGTGNPKREFLHVDDLAKAVLLCLEFYNSPEPINIGTGIDLTIRELASKIAKLTEFDGLILWDKSRDDGALEKVLDIEKISKLGWKPLIGLDQGIKSTLEWYQSNKMGKHNG